MRTKLGFVAAALIAAFAAAGPSVAQSFSPYGTVPGGITLVPGTVVTPQVGGSAVTGTVPLAGTIGSAGVQNFDPQLGLGINPNAGTQYPIAPYSPYQLAPVFPNQSTLPQLPPVTPGIAGPGLNGLPNIGNPSATVCPYGTTSISGLC
jgi:hypothetical protein